METKFNRGDLVVVQITQSRTKHIEQTEGELIEHVLTETSKHTSKIIKRKYVKTVETADGVETVHFDGYCYQCDDGSVYYPNWDNGGKIVTLSLATEEDIDFLGD